MARQHVHNRRAGHGGGSGASWISYSDIMAALVLVFVLFLVYNLYQYNSAIQLKTAELAEQQALVSEQEGLIIIQQNALDEATAQLLAAQGDLEVAQDALAAQIIILGEQQTELETLRLQLAQEELALASATDLLAEQQAAFAAQTGRISGIVGIRTEIIEALTRALAQNDISATVDPTTGDIVLSSTIFFETGSYAIKAEGQQLLNNFLPVYLSVLLDPAYSDYLAEIIIEGHTDSSGTYLRNLELSQNRALAVAKYCLTMPGLSEEMQVRLQQIMTATGRSSSDLVYREDGTEDRDASRRVEFKFSLKDAEMVEEMQRILQQTTGGGEG